MVPEEQLSGVACAVPHATAPSSSAVAKPAVDPAVILVMEVKPEMLQFRIYTNCEFHR
jgi:hypothetical protein